jgi:hypothetical protein
MYFYLISTFPFFSNYSGCLSIPPLSSSNFHPPGSLEEILSVVWLKVCSKVEPGS